MVAHTTCELDDQIVWIAIERGQHDADIVPVIVVNFRTMQKSGKIVSGSTTENYGF
jgi:hypothetical protein